ncbi:MAG: transcriptional repressor [Planctomycetes bacterium]|nr:transcriptional repressor [Planctomycetota bacterium]
MASGNEQKMLDFEEICRNAGLKVTPQRRAVYKALIESKEHPSADMIFRKVRADLGEISLDTVNRTLLTLSEIGAAFTVEGSGDAKRFDGNLSPHQHFKCLKCKSVIDFHHKDFDDIKIPKDICKNYKILRKSVYLEGFCDKCTL